MTLPELIAALEAAEGPSRELDAEIAHATEWTGMELVEWPPFWPPFTSSIDAALTLVPEKFYWSVGSLTDEHSEPHHEYGAQLYLWSHVADKDDVIEHGATPAIALCIAAVKARQG
jgi:hypothetical protein